MITDLIGRIAEGIVTPRTSLRGFLDRGPHGPDTVVALVVLAYLVQAISALVVPGASTAEEGQVLVWHVAGLTFHAILFALAAALVFGVGRVFGGIAQVRHVVLAMAWYFFLTSFLAPLSQFGIGAAMDGEESALSGLLFLATSVIGVWVLAGFVAEIHGFRNTGAVLGAMVALMLLSSVLLSPLIGAA